MTQYKVFSLLVPKNRGELNYVKTSEKYSFDRKNNSFAINFQVIQFSEQE